ncbi:MAG TPA: zinc dependent phospholipase C family protein [Acholeplasmataceae bacterium]|jgi:hypothetical protein|nr:zinc dependent phospholipase C family protein [Acholeplasmataceae bacterium]
MPDLVMHHYFGRKVLEGLDKDLISKIELDTYDFATAGPDPFFFISFLNRKENPKHLEFGGFMHRNNTKEFLLELIEETKNNPLLKSYLYGFVTHYFLDTFTHPYVFHFTGNYEKENEDTLVYRGLHTKLERAMDTYIIKKYYYSKPHKFKIYKNILKLKKLNQNIENEINKVYKKVYGIEDGFDLVNKSIKDQKKFYRFIYDPFGLKNKLFALLDNGKSSIDFKVLSYYGKEILDIDIFNFKNQKWTNPVDDRLTFNDSFFDLFDEAKTKAIETIKNIEKYLNDEKVILDDYIKNTSYITGLDCCDTRPMRFFNNIFGSSKA